MFEARSTADSLERDLRAMATVERADNEERYLRSDLEFVGATVARPFEGTVPKVKGRSCRLAVLLYAARPRSW
ncbi:MAG: hypothetical protein M3346_06700 [Actinomycetota bacterium]|nr:hypothetical protein [Actinomycetota bacterium]